MKALTQVGLFFATALFVAAPLSAAHIEARIGLGLQAGDFFDPASGFSNGDTTHTNTMSYNDGVVQVDFTLTAEAYDSGGSPAGLQVNNQAAGVELGVNNNQVDPGESIKFTYDAISYSVIGALPPGEVLDPASLLTTLSTVRFAAFDSGTDTYTYSGVGDGVLAGDDTQELGVHTPIVDGDMFTITGDSGAFRILYLSQGAAYGTIPEPSALVIAAFGAVGLAARRRV